MSEAASTTEPAPFSWKAFLTKKRSIPRSLKRTFRYSCYIILCLFIAGALTSYFFGSQCSLLFMTHEAMSAEDRKELSLLTTPLPDTTETASGVSHEVFGVSLTPPCPQPYRSELHRTLWIFHCDSHLNGVLEDPSSQLSGTREMLLEGYGHAEAIRIFGADMLSSDFATMNAILSVRPQDNSISLGRARANRLLVLTLFKHLLVMSGTREIHPVSNAEFLGFEFVREKGVELDLFDTSNHKIVIRLNRNPGPITQPEVNEIVHSLHSISNAAATSNHD